jgi:predicted alpha/beta hydrolase family esterase
MTKQILFVQGGGEGTHDEWDNRLVASLKRELGPGYEIRYPYMPNEGDPSYDAWKVKLLNEIEALEDGAILVGHSLGGTILINAIAEQPPKRKLAGIFLIAAPFVGGGGWPSEDINPPKGMGARLPAGVPVYLYHGSADETAPIAHLALYAEAFPRAHVRRLEGRDHQLNEDLSEIACDIRDAARVFVAGS